MMMGAVPECERAPRLDWVRGITLWERAPADTRGTIILTPGFPPEESGDVLGLGATLCNADWRVVQFQPPGSWSSSGAFTLAEIAATLGDILSEAKDPPRVLLGHSAGGLFNAAVLSLGVPLEGLVAVAAPNGAVMAADFEVDPDLRRHWIRQFDSLVGPGRPIHSGNGRQFSSELMDWRERLGFEALARRMIEIRVLFVDAAEDGIVPTDRHLQPLHSLLRNQQGAPNVRVRTLGTDHDFSSDRPTLANVIVEWLDQFPRGV